MIRKYGATSIVLFLLSLALFIEAGTPRLAAAEPAGADLKVLELFPDDVLAAAIVPRLSDLDVKVAKLGGALKIPVPGLLTMAKAMSGIQAGLDEQRATAFVVVAPAGGQGDPQGVGFVAISDYQKLIAPFAPESKGKGISLIKIPGTRGVLIAQKGSYAVFVEETQKDQTQLESVLARQPGVPAAIAPLKDWIAKQDASYIMTQSGVKILTDKALKTLRASLAMAHVSTADQALAIYEKIFAALEKEAAQVGVGVRIDDDATVRLTSQVRFVAGGDWSKAGANVPPLHNPPLTGLPALPFAFAFDGCWGGSMSDWMSNMSISIMKPMMAAKLDAKMSDEDLKKLADVMKGVMKGVNSMSFVLGVPEQGSSIYSNAFGVMQVDDATAYLTSYETRMGEMSKLMSSMNNPMFGEYEFKKTDHDGVPTLEMTYDMSKMIKQIIDQNPGVVAPSKDYWNTMFGPDGKMSIYLSAADPKTVTIVYVNPNHIKTAVDAAKQPGNSAATDADLKTTVALLPKEANWVAFVSPTGIMQFAKFMMQTTMPQMPVQIPDFPKTPPIGMSAKITAESLDGQLVVPAAVLDGAGTLIQQMQHSAVRQ